MTWKHEAHEHVARDQVPLNVTVSGDSDDLMVKQKTSLVRMQKEILTLIVSQYQPVRDANLQASRVESTWLGLRL